MLRATGPELTALVEALRVRHGGRAAKAMLGGGWEELADASDVGVEGMGW